MKQILIVEDDPMISCVVRDGLEFAGYQGFAAHTLSEARALFQQQSYDLILMDVSLPDGEGFDLTREFKKEVHCPPIIYMTSHSHINYVRRGYESGCSDYLKKPFEIEELCLRIKKVLNEFESGTGQERHIGDYFFNPVTQALRHKNDKIVLGRLQSAVLTELSNQIGEVVRKDDLLNEYWGEANYFTSRNLNSTIVKLRQRFKDDPRVCFLALKKEGYRLIINS